MSTHTTLVSTLLCCGLLSTTLLVAATGRLEGTVTDGSFKLEGVTVRAFPQANQKEPNHVPTDKDGYYQFKAIETGAYKLKYWKEGFKTEYRDINVSAYPPATKVPEVTMKPAPPGSVTGQTIDPKGNPVNAVVQAVSADSGRTFKAEHDGRGGFNIKLSEGTYQFIASAEGYFNAAAGVEVEADKTKSVTLILTPNPPRPPRPIP